MNEQEERMEDRPNQKIWFDGGNREWKLDGRSRTFRRKVYNIRWRNNKLEGTVIYRGKNVNVRYVSEGDWNAHFSYTDDAELERDYGRGPEAEYEKKEAEKEGSDFDEECYSAEQLLIRTKNKITADYVRVGGLIEWLEEKEDALHVSPEWDAIKGALELAREAYTKLRAAAGSIDIGLEFIRENK